MRHPEFQPDLRLCFLRVCFNNYNQTVSFKYIYITSQNVIDNEVDIRLA